MQPTAAFIHMWDTMTQERRYLLQTHPIDNAVVAHNLDHTRHFLRYSPLRHARKILLLAQAALVPLSKPG
jgi:hypothetical protein